MRIGIDLDDVLVDFAGPLIQHYNPILGKNFTREDSKAFHIENLWECTKEEALSRLRAYYAHHHPAHLPPMNGASEAVQRLSEEHALFIITGRPLLVSEKTHQT